jgi:hypothetical protein
VHLAVTDEMQGSGDHASSVGSLAKTECHIA